MPGKFSPSKAHRWLVCPGSVQYDTEGEESVWAEEGSHAHAILEQILKGIPVLTGDIVMDRPAPAHRIQQAIEIRDFIRQWHAQHPDFVMESETPVHVADAIGASGLREYFDGTADVVAYSVIKKELVILDAKFGFVRVEPKNNPQLYLYAMGALYELISCFDTDQNDWSITVIIAQPDYEGVIQTREHRMRYPEFHAWWTQYAAIRVSRAISGGKTIDPSSEHACRYCPGRAICIPRQEVLREFVKDEWRMTKTLGELLPILPQIRHICDDLEAEAVRELAKGMTVPGYKLVESRSIRKWDEARKADMLIDAHDLGIEPEKLLAEPKLLSPAQVEKKFKTGNLGKELTKTYAVTPRGAPKLAPESDPRPAYTPPEDFSLEEIDSLLKEE